VRHFKDNVVVFFNFSIGLWRWLDHWDFLVISILWWASYGATWYCKIEAFRLWRVVNGLILPTLLKSRWKGLRRACFFGLRPLKWHVWRCRETVRTAENVVSLVHLALRVVVEAHRTRPVHRVRRHHRRLVEIRRDWLRGLLLLRARREGSSRWLVLQGRLRHVSTIEVHRVVSTTCHVHLMWVHEARVAHWVS
jgi:hypothetical protein